MSDGYSGAGAAPYDSPNEGSSTVDTAKQAVGTAAEEASKVASTTREGAADVASTAKSEATSVASEAKSQVKDLYGQARGQLSDQASQQQERIATGLSSLGDELGSMSRNSESSGIAADLVHQASTRLSAAGSWLADRDPASVLDELKSFARRRPGAFIAGAALAGIVVGRLTRALAAGASSDSTAAGGASGFSTPPVPSTPPALAAATPPVTTPPVTTPPAATPPVVTSAPTGTDPFASAEYDVVTEVPGESPLFDESAARLGTTQGGESTDERRDTF